MYLRTVGGKASQATAAATGARYFGKAIASCLVKDERDDCCVDWRVFKNRLQLISLNIMLFISSYRFL